MASLALGLAPPSTIAMNWPPEVQIALQALARNKMTSGLAMLGICFGVGAYICSVSIGKGAARQIQDQIEGLGENMIWVEAGSRNVNGVRTGTHGDKSLTPGDAVAIGTQIALISNASPNVDARAQVVHGNKNWATRVRGVNPAYLPIRRLAIQQGSCFSDDDVRRATNTCVLGPTIVRELFGEEDPVGKTILLQHLVCRVTGVLAAKGVSPNGQDQDDVIIMPFTTVQKKIMGIAWLDDIMCSAVSASAIQTAEDDISALLRQRHHLRDGQDDDFNLRHPTSVLEAGAESQRIMTLLLASIASVALLVGGIGVMNIMLASVTDRTREIGIRRAVGARRRDILAQFLVESVTLTLIGGGIGILLGIAGSDFIARFAAWRTMVEPGAVVVAVGFAGGVGIVFGAYPAFIATRLDPVVALGR
jgi:putative ABC transport system permease protein